MIQHLPTVLFLATAGMVFAMHLRFQIPFYRAVSRLEEAYRQQGRVWSYWKDMQFRQQFSLNERTIFNAADTPEIRILKERMVQCRHEIKSSFKKLLVITWLGLISVAVAIVLKMALAH